jgi:hypothetical protein
VFFSRHFSDVVDLAVVLHAAGGLMQPADRADMFATVTASKSSPIFLFLGSIILLNSPVSSVIFLFDNTFLAKGRATKYVYIYKEYHSGCPLVGIGTLPTPLSPASVPLPPEPGGGTLACG